MAPASTPGPDRPPKAPHNAHAERGERVLGHLNKSRRLAHVVVSGTPGAGKSTVALTLARSFALPILAKDPVKEALWDQLGGGGVELSKRFGRAANEVILSIAASAPPSVLESFWAHEWALERLATLPDGVVEVFCDCPPPIARQRYRARVRHPAHLDAIRARDGDLWAKHRARPLFDDCVRVDTATAVDTEALASALGSHPRWKGAPSASPPALVIITGLPGTGKTTIATALSHAMGAVVLGRDVIGAALTRTGVTAPGDHDGVAFDLLAVIAAEQLKAGTAAILDSVGGFASTSARWRALAATHGVPLMVIECTCSDERVHRDRIEGRSRGIPGWYELTWAHVENVRRRYEPWSESRLVLDATAPLEASIAAALRHLTDASGTTQNH